MSTTKPTKPPAQGSSPQTWRVSIIVAVIAAVATIVAALLNSSVLEGLWRGETATTAGMTVRVANATGESVAGAKVLLFFAGGPLSTYTDSNGAAQFATIDPTVSAYQLIIEGTGYDIYEQMINPAHDQSVAVRLDDLGGETGTIIVRVVDDTTNTPVQGGQVQLLVGGENYAQATDSNGISTFSLNFPAEGLLEADISVVTSDYAVNNQRLTLQPNKTQDIRLNPARDTAQVAPLQVAAVSVPLETDLPALLPRRVPCATNLQFGQTVACTLSTGTETLTHTLEVARNDHVVITMVRVADLLEPQLAVVDTQGNRLHACTAAESLVAEVTCQFEEPGTYAIQVGDRRETHGGAYLLTIQRRNHPSNALPLPFGELVTDAVHDVAQRNTYTFDVGVDDIARITVAKTADAFQPAFQVYNPDGGRVSACGGDDSLFVEVTCTFDKAGTHSLHIRDRGQVHPGQYTVAIQRLNRPSNAQTLAIGDVGQGSLTHVAQHDTLVFDAVRDQQVTITATRTEGLLEPAFQVYNANGRTLRYCAASGAAVAEVTCELADTGTYLILVTDRSRVNTGAYEVAVAQAP